MELKGYQNQVLRNLESYLAFLSETHDMQKAYVAHWTAQDVHVGTEQGKMYPYRNTIPGAPHICFKVPTGGGKTFLACASVKPILDAMPEGKQKVVVWLVPSNAILEQTIGALSNPNHPYRQRLDRDFGGRTRIYTKEPLLNGQDFNPTTVREYLSVCILSYDSLRSNKKDGRKVYQQNSQLAQFVKCFASPETLIEGVDDTALIQVLNQLSPVIIVDESHNAQSDLSVEMLNNLNPSFVLDLTATPKSNSNIISITDVRELKKAKMVKLPVVVYNRESRNDVIHNAIHLRAELEREAMAAEAAGCRYIRPIILFQAQPKTAADNTTFEKLKTMLVEMGISKDEIAIKTSEVNELKNIDLLSSTCQIRYIITVNALKEGWDCPFAYILATLTNKTSSVDVEQILGRILRQPYASKSSASLLNTSYVLTCSNDFRNTLENVVKGLNRAGFTRKDFRAIDETVAPVVLPQVGEQLTIPTPAPKEDSANDAFEDIDPAVIRASLEQEGEEPSLPPVTAGMLHQAQDMAEEYDHQLESSEGTGLLGGELGNMMNQFTMLTQFEAAQTLLIPQFFSSEAPDLFGGEYRLLERENLSDGFTLQNKDATIHFDLATGDMYNVDIQATGEAVPKYQRASEPQSKYIREHIAKLAPAAKIRTCTDAICKQLNKSDAWEAGEVHAYVERIIKNMSEDELTAMETAYLSYAQKIKEKIDSLEADHRAQQFKKMLDTGEIVCRPSYVLPKAITPVETYNLDKSLYESEGLPNGFEQEVVSAIAGQENIRWWHRIIERKDYEFRINGYINHYPDFMLMTEKDNLIMLETKGDDRDNSDSEKKLKLGRIWAEKAGVGFKYFMVFKNKNVQWDGAYTLDEFMEIAKRL